MKICIYRSSGEQLTRNYDLTTCSVTELERSLLDHCKAFDIDPLVAGILIVDECLIKSSCTITSLQDVAIKILKYAGRDYSKEAA